MTRKSFASRWFRRAAIMLGCLTSLRMWISPQHAVGVCGVVDLAFLDLDAHVLVGGLVSGQLHLPEGALPIVLPELRHSYRSCNCQTSCLSLGSYSFSSFDFPIITMIINLRLSAITNISIAPATSLLLWKYDMSISVITTLFPTGKNL